MPYGNKNKWNLKSLGGQYRIKKRGTLREDSSLGLKGINILYVNLSSLVGKRSCIILYTLFCNRYQVLISALANLKVNAFVLIDIKCAIKLVNFLNIPLEELPKPILIHKYNK